MSFGSLASGPVHTFQLGSNVTTIDYVLVNYDAIRGVSSCITLEDHALNTSDHLPIKCTVDLTHLRYSASTTFPSQPLNWTEGEKSHHTTLYAKATDEIVRPLAQKEFHSIEEVDFVIKYVCQEIVKAAENVISKKKLKPSVRIKDKALFQLCWKSHVAFRKWKETGRPLQGPIADKRKKCKRNVAS